jgi:CRP-like cAMP-binding protein
VLPADNQLLALLPRTEVARLRAHAEAVHLRDADVLHEPRRPMRHVYFPTEAWVSLRAARLADPGGGPGLEIGLVGCEGLLGEQLALGVTRSPVQARVQGAGLAWRLEAGAFRRELQRCPTLQRVILRYVHVRMLQLTALVGCVHQHLIGARLARWLLVSEDRARAPHFRMTHEGLSALLGVRRVGVTMAAGELQRAGLIRYHRGDLQVTDRAGLRVQACGCYAADRQAYADWLGPPLPRGTT